MHNPVAQSNSLFYERMNRAQYRIGEGMGQEDVTPAKRESRQPLAWGERKRLVLAQNGHLFQGKHTLFEVPSTTKTAG